MSHARRCRVIAISLGLSLLAAPGRSDVTRYVPFGSGWKLFPGLAEPSVEPGAWRAVAFDDSSWAPGRAPLGYGVPAPLSTDLSKLEPPMRASYTTLYLRATFELTDPAGVVDFHASADYDDGFILWINGVEAARANAPAAAEPPATAIAAASRTSGTPELFDELPNPQTFLVKGTNVVAVQAFNVAKTNNDFYFDLELFDPFGPDLSPPRIVSLTPAAGATVRSLEQIEVVFGEEVRGVGARDLFIGGRPAEEVGGSGVGPYVFRFPAAPDGEIVVSWDDGHGITDVAPAPNPFAGGSWRYNVDSTAPEVDLVIAEVSATGAKGFLDADREESDWIEVWNRGITRVALGGWSLSDDPQDPGKWVFPDLTLEPGARRVVFASGKDRRDPAAELHASFSLSASGEYVGLFRPESPRTPISELAPRFPEQRPGWSFGLGSDGRAGYLAVPTPGKPNGPAVSLEGFVSEPLLGAPHGLYDEPLDLTLTSTTAGATIRYTLDGSEPTVDGGTPYTGPIRIEGTTERGVVTVRAAAFKEGRLPSRAVTSTYIFPAHVIAQPAAPVGFPPAWGAQRADYAMDPTVIAAVGDRALRGLRSISSVSVVAHVDDLFSRARGVYANPSLSGDAWERPVSAELIHPDGRRGFQVDCGLRVTGGSSTADWKSIKVSLRLVFRGDYGAKKLEAPVFEGSRVDRFDALVLDAHLNLAYTHPDHAQRVRSQFVRDAFVSDLQKATGSLAPHDRFVHLYLNGLYWGMYDLHERPDAAFAAEHLGGEKEEYDAYRHNTSTLIDGTPVAWNEMFRLARLNLGSSDNYLALAQYLDIPDLADYMLVNLYTGNTDWAHQNWYAGRHRVPGAGYRFFSWDAEHVLKSTAENVVGVSNPGGPGELYTKLRQSPEFRLLFADHVQRHLFGAGPMAVNEASPAWDPASPQNNRPAALYMRRIAEIDTAVILESARWGDARRPGQPYTRDNEFQAELDLLLDTYFPQRTRVVLGQLAGAGLFPRVPAPLFSRDGGEVQPGAAVALSLPAGATGRILYTTDGTDPRVAFTGAVASSALEPAGPIVIQDSTVVKARTLDGETWSALAEASFTVIGPRDALRVTELHYHPPESLLTPGGMPWPEFIELENTAAASVDLAGVYFSSGVTFGFLRGAVLGPGARIVLTSDASAFRDAYPGVPVGGVFPGGLADGGEKLELRDARDEVIVSFAYDDEGFWPQGPDGFGWSLVLRSPELDPRDPASWRSSVEAGGSPGAAEPGDGVPAIRIDEVLASSSEPLEDAIELFNPTDRAVDLSGWFLGDDRAGIDSLKKYRLPDGTSIAAGGYLVIYERDFDPGFDVPGSFALSSSGDEVCLASATPAGELTGHISSHRFGASEDGVSIGAHATSSGLAFSRLCAPTFGVEAPRSVEEFRDGLGAANAPALVGPVVLSEIHYHPAGGPEFLELHNASGAEVRLHDAALGASWRIGGLLDEAGTDDFELPADGVIAAHGFLVLTAVEPAAFRELYPVPAGVPVIGPYRGALDNAGERLALLKPVRSASGVGFVAVDEVRYGDADPWPPAADGEGPSLERRAALAYGDDAGNWGASREAGGTPGAPSSAALPPGGGKPRAQFEVAGDAAEPLRVSLDASSSHDVDGTVTGYDWDFGDGDTAQGASVAHVYRAAGRYTVRLRVTDDAGLVGIAVRTLSVPSPGAGGLRVPGDVNGDSRLDLSDAIGMLRRLFFGDASPAPCGDALTAGGSLTLLDSDASGALDITDVIRGLNYLYRGGPPPALGVECVRIPGCADACTR